MKQPKNDNVRKCSIFWLLEQLRARWAGWEVDRAIEAQLADDALGVRSNSSRGARAITDSAQQPPGPRRWLVRLGWFLPSDRYKMNNEWPALSGSFAFKWPGLQIDDANGESFQRP